MKQRIPTVTVFTNTYSPDYVFSWPWQTLPMSLVTPDGTVLVTVVARNSLGCEVVANPGAIVRVAAPSLSDIAVWATGSATFLNASTLLRAAYLGVRANVTAARNDSNFQSLANLGASALAILQVKHPVDSSQRLLCYG